MKINPISQKTHIELQFLPFQKKKKSVSYILRMPDESNVNTASRNKLQNRKVMNLLDLEGM